MEAVSLHRLLPDLAYYAGTAAAATSPPRHLDVGNEDGRSHLHLVGESWELRISWHRLEK